MAFPIIPKRRSGASGNPTTLQLGELAVNTLNGELYLGADAGVTLLNGPVAAGTTVTEHTADGTTTAFTFGGYNGTADGGYIVSVGGIDQPPSKYSISATAGGTITFVEAPTDGELISIRAIVAGSGGGGGSGDATSLQGVAISTTAPASNEALVYNGTDWGPAPIVAASGNATELQGYPVSNGIPMTSWFLGFNGTQWESTQGPSNAASLNNVPVSAVSPSTGQALVYSGTEWAASSVSAVQLQGYPIDTFPSGIGEGAVLSYNGIKWIASNTDARLLQGTPISAAAPVTGNLLQYSGTQWVPFDGIAIPNWSSGVYYNSGDRVVRNGVIYLATGTTNTDPAATTDPTSGWLQEIGSSSSSGPSNPTAPGFFIRVNSSGSIGYIPVYQ